MSFLLTREQFKAAVFERDRYRCVICGKPATDAHHIMDRKLWPDGGYYIENGVSVCAQHHWSCEQNRILPDRLREIVGIELLLPPGLDPEFKYNKWGDPIDYADIPS